MLDHYRLIARSLTQLFKPLIEVVIHDFKTNKIVFIDGMDSLRKVGDNSGLTKRERSLEEGIIGPYIKNASDGSMQKSISVVLGKERKYMLCINFAVGQFKEMEMFLQSFVGLQSAESQDTFFDTQWQDKLHAIIGEHLRSNNKTVDQLGRDEKKNLVIYLESKGAFEGKNAASYIGKILKISRATVYSYLKYK